MKNLNIISVDIGAGSGRVILTTFDGNIIKSKEIYRFANNSVYLGDTFYWDFLNLMLELKNGFRKASEAADGKINNIGIDTWGADFGLLDSYGSLLANPVSYRDNRTNIAEKHINKIIDRDRLNDLNSSLTYTYCTLFQLYYDFKFRSEFARLARTYLPIPNLINYFLTGEKVIDQSILSGSQFFDIKERRYREDILKLLEIDSGILPKINNAGKTIGNLKKEFARSVNLNDSTTVSLVCSHDSASAVTGVPLDIVSLDCCYINSGTWSVIGMESEEPVLGGDIYKYNFTNWAAFRDRNMFVKIINGFYFIQECKKVWDSEDNKKSNYAEFYNNITITSLSKSLINLESSALIGQDKKMPAVIRDYLKDISQIDDFSKNDLILALLQSMVLEYRIAIGELERLSKKKFKKIYMVGGGSLNRIFCQWISDCLAKEVYTGYSESTINGNILAQLFALGEIKSIEEGREIIRDSHEEIVFHPESVSGPDWSMLLEKYIKLKKTYK